MARTSLYLPQLGNEITEAQVDFWLKAAGDAVAEGEAIVSVTTPKVTMELEAPAAGVLAEILVAEGELADVGAELAIIETA